MGITTYHNLDLEALDYHKDGEAEHFRVYVAASPVGQQKRTEAEKVALTPELHQRLRQLAQGCLALPELIELGEALAALILPPRARSFLVHSQELLKSDEGLRIRLRLCNYALADLPWEYVYISLTEASVAQEEKGPDGFLALNRRFSLVRSVTHAQPMSPKPAASSSLRIAVLSAGAEPADARGQRLGVVPQQIAELLQDVQGVSVECYPNATLDMLDAAVEREAQVFHFVGCGHFAGAPEEGYGTCLEQGEVLLQDARGQDVRFSAVRLAQHLSGRGIHLAVLDFDATDDPTYLNPWLGIAPALIQQGIPAVVGMQRAIDQQNAAAFYRRLYRALAKGQPLDTAIVDSRLAIFNRSSNQECDWGKPVLYVSFDAAALFAQARAREPQPATATPGQETTSLSARVSAPINRHTLRDVLVRAFNLEELEALCVDVEQYLADEGIVLLVNLEIVGGSSKAAKLANLIKYLDREDQLAYLVKAVRSARPGLI